MKKDIESVNVLVSQTLSKNFIVETDDYVETWEDDYDDETHEKLQYMVPDYSETNFREAFINDLKVYNLQQLLSIFKEMLKEKIDKLIKDSKDKIFEDPNAKKILMREVKRYTNIYNSADGWTIDEEEYFENE